jgi:RNA polymerase sigma factor (sigma-70 family)
MTTHRISNRISIFRPTSQPLEMPELADGQLLDRFIEAQDETAFAAIVRRHGPMVLGVCRRILHNYHNAEDAFQATFLVLARKARSIRRRSVVVSWLYGVAVKTAMRALSSLGRRGAREKQVPDMPEPQFFPKDDYADLVPLLDQELNHLPEKYRLPIVLRDLQGKGYEEAARQLGWLPGTFAGRLSRGRKILAARLARRQQRTAGGATPIAM